MLPPLAILAVLFINAIFSGAYLYGKIGVEHFPPFLFAALRFLVVTIVLSPFLRINKEMLQYWRPALTFCLMMGPGVYALMYWALDRADGAASILIGTQLATPLAVLMGVFLLDEKVVAKKWYGIIIVTLGVFIVGFDTVILGYPLAFLLIFISSAFYAGSNITSRSLRHSSISVINLNAWMGLISFPSMLLLSWLSNEAWQQPLSTTDVQAWSSILYSSIVVSLVGHVGLFAMFKRYPIVAIMPYYVFTPIFGVIGAILFLGEQPTWRFFIGATLAIIGILIINSKQSKNKTYPSES